MNVVLSETVRLVEIHHDDYSELFTLMSRIYPPAYQYLWNDDCSWYLNQLYSQDQVNQDIREENGFFYFVEVDNKKEGILKIQLGQTYPDQIELKATRLHRIYLSESIQGKGVSYMIMRYVEQLAKDSGSQILWLDCMDSKHQALNYYTKHGFQKGTLSNLDYGFLKDQYRGIYLMSKKV